jgi:hypothetical protein
VLIGFVTAADAARLSHETDEAVTVELFPDAEGDATTIVAISYDSVVQHRQYSVRSAGAISVQVWRPRAS